MVLSLLLANRRLSSTVLHHCGYRARWASLQKGATTAHTLRSCSTGSGSASVVNAALVKELRGMTGASMGKCRQALMEESGDIEKAVDWLRKRGIRSMQRRTNEVAESLLAICVDGSSAGSIVELHAETDFVTHNALFQHLAVSVACTSAAEAGDLPAQSSEVGKILVVARNPELKSKLSEGASVETAFLEIGSVLGERIVLGRHHRVEAPTGGVVAGYAHPKQSGAVSGTGRMVALVSLCGLPADAAKNPALLDIASQLARHIVASRPRFVNVADIPPETMEKERQTMKEAYLEELDEKRKKAMKDEVLTKVLEGKTKKFLQDVVLSQQELTIPNSEADAKPTSVEKWLKSEAAALGFDSLVIHDFRFVSL